jgi:hypothetical protein
MKEKFNLVLDASQIYESQTCPLKWWYHYKENLALIPFDTEAMDKGTLVHQLLELYYNFRFNEPNGNKLTHAQLCIDIFMKERFTQTLFPSDNSEIEQFICERFLLYVMRYMNDDFNLRYDSKIAPVELGFSKLLFENDEVRFIVEGRIDLVANIQDGRACFVDHKSQEKAINLYRYKPQFKTYAWATGYNWGIVNYFGLQADKNNDLMKNGKLFRRDLIYFEKWMIDEWEEKLKLIFWEIYYSLKLENSFETEKSLYLYRNDSACGGAFDCNPCQFTHLCELESWSMKEQLKSFKYAKMEPWTPWRLKEKVKE